MDKNLRTRTYPFHWSLWYYIQCGKHCWPPTSLILTCRNFWILEPASQRLYISHSWRLPIFDLILPMLYIEDKTKVIQQCKFLVDISSGASRAHGFVPSRGFPQDCTRTALSSPFGHRFSPVQACPIMWQWPRRLSRVQPAVICGARSAFRRWSCSTCERRYERIHCLRKYNARFNIHVQGKTTLIFPAPQSGLDNKDSCFLSARAEDDSRASHRGAKRAEPWRGGLKSWELAIGLVVASGGETETGKDKQWGGHSRRTLG